MKTPRACLKSKRILRIGVIGAVLFFLIAPLLDKAINAAITELAKVNNSVITLEEFNKKYNENLRFFQLKPPTKKSVLDELINRQLGIQEAKRLGLDRDPEVVDRMNTVLYHALIEKKLSKDFENIQVTIDDAKNYYEKNPEIRTSHIFVSVKPNATAIEQKQAYDKIKKIYDEYITPGKMSFAEVAQRFSESPTAAMGGDIGYQNRDHLDPTYYEAARNLKTPEKVTGIVRTPFGYYIIKLTAIRPWDEVDKVEAKRMDYEAKRTRIFENYLNQLRSHAQVMVHSEFMK